MRLLRGRREALEARRGRRGRSRRRRGLGVGAGEGRPTEVRRGVAEGGPPLTMGQRGQAVGGASGAGRLQRRGAEAWRSARLGDESRSRPAAVGARRRRPRGVRRRGLRRVPHPGRCAMRREILRSCGAGPWGAARRVGLRGGVVLGAAAGDRAVNDELPGAVDLQPANVVQALVLQQLGDPGVAERGLAEVEAEARAKEALDIRHGDHPGLDVARAADDHRYATAHVLPCRDGERRGLRLLRRAAEGLLPRSALLLDGLLGQAVRHDVAIDVSEELLLRHRELHDVADLTERAPLEEGEFPLLQGSGASVAPAGQQRLLAAQAGEVGRQRGPELRGVPILAAGDVHEVLGFAGQQHGNLVAIDCDDLELPASLADALQRLGVDVGRLVEGLQRYLASGGGALTAALLLLAAVQRQGAVLADPAEENPPERLELVGVEAPDGLYDLHLRRRQEGGLR
mmetsp:Transcript_60177/g.173606  ORF Transcript_60177/g.173606 Transcript_60177/m.173606 type:complete len:457 (+) Transcript_60177:660-2030(+)